MQKQTACPDCGTTMMVSPDMVGDIATCKNCGQSFPVIVSASPRSSAGSGSAPRPAGSAAPAAAAPVAAGGKRIGKRYAVRGELGQGAFGVVYQADDLMIKRSVAIKMLRPEVVQSADAAARLQREAEVLSQIVHPNILPVLEFGKCPEGHYVVFPLVKGQTLQDSIPPDGFSDPRKAVRLVSKLVLALHYVYETHHILHRDVKPANVLMLEGAEEALYLMDFGLAACQHSNLTRLANDRMVMGTPAFMSPEQATGDHKVVGHRSDLYAAGVVLFQLLTGRVPFESGWPEILSHIVYTAPPAPSTVRPDLDRALDAIVLKALSKKPEGRFSTGKEFADVLDRWLQNRSQPAPSLTTPAPLVPIAPISVPVPSVQGTHTAPASRAEAPLSRISTPPPLPPAQPRRGVLWLMLFGLLLLAGGLLGGYFVWRRAEKPRGQKKDWWDSQ